MRPAMRFHSLGAAPRLDLMEPPASARDEALVTILRASISHLDRTVASGSLGVHPPLPFIGGVEGVGLVDGERVLVRGHGIGVERDGCWTTETSVPRQSLLPLPNGLSDEQAVVFFAPSSTAARAVDVARVEPGCTVLVTGAAGAVGSIVAQMCRRAGAHVIGTSRREGVEPPHCDEVLTGDPHTIADRLTTQPHVLIDTVGGRGAWDLLMSIEPGGRAVMIGYTAGRELRLDLAAWMFRDVELIPINMVRAGEWARERFEHLATQFSEGELEIATETIGLGDVPEGLERLAAGSVSGRLVIDPSN